MKYEVTMQAIIERTIVVDAASESEAGAIAADIFVAHEATEDEQYQQKVMGIKPAPLALVGIVAPSSRSLH